MVPCHLSAGTPWGARGSPSVGVASHRPGAAVWRCAGLEDLSLPHLVGAAAQVTGWTAWGGGACTSHLGSLTASPKQDYSLLYSIALP